MASQELTWQAATAKNILDARKKNGRLGSKKTRSGCLTCKTRRVKCDEAKPECNRCQSTGRKCDGYQNLNPVTRTNQSLIGSQLSHLLGLADEERRTFDFFLSWTAPRLAGSLDKDFWCGYVLQVAQSESFVLDSLLAISTLYEHPQYMISFHHPQPDARDDDDSVKVDSPNESVHPHHDENHVYALQLYNRAIRAFTKRMEEGKATPLLAILSCLLFICIELIRDDVFAALSLFTRGTQLLKDFDTSLSEDSEQSLVSIIRLMFARLNVLAVTSGHPRPKEVPPEPLTIGQKRGFANMHDARTALFNLMADSHDFVRDANAWKDSLILGGGTNSVEPTDASPNGYIQISIFDSVSHVSDKGGLKTTQCPISDLEETVLPGSIELNTVDSFARRVDYIDLFPASIDQAHGDLVLHNGVNQSLGQRTPGNLLKREAALQDRLSLWLDAFHGPRKQLGDTEPETSSHLLMYYHVFVIWLSTRLDAKQTAFDDFTYHFEEIIRHAQAYIKAKAVEQSNFTFEVGVVPPLYFTATKCRIPSLRRRALDLLSQAPKKEGTWGACSTAELVCCLITIEEDGLGFMRPDCTGHCASKVVNDRPLPHDEKRVHTHEVLRNKLSHSFDMRVTRYSAVDGRLLRTLEDFPI